MISVPKSVCEPAAYLHVVLNVKIGKNYIRFFLYILWAPDLTGYTRAIEALSAITFDFLVSSS